MTFLYCRHVLRCDCFQCQFQRPVRHFRRPIAVPVAVRLFRRQRCTVYDRLRCPHCKATPKLILRSLESPPLFSHSPHPFYAISNKTKSLKNVRPHSILSSLEIRQKQKPARTLSFSLPAQRCWPGLRTGLNF